MKKELYITIGFIIIFVATTLGSGLVFILNRKRNLSEKLNQCILGFAGGVMMSASLFSLLLPALESEVTYMPSYVVVIISILIGFAFIWGIDKLVPHFHTSDNAHTGLPSKKINKTFKMFLAVTIHNIPEGLAVGIAYGVALNYAPEKLETGLMSALMLAVGLAIQNIPEGLAVSLPIEAETKSTWKAFLFGTLSGAVEPLAALLGLVLAKQIISIMPWALSFAAGCMIYVVVEEMIPESKSDSSKSHGVWAFMIGFLIMMALDVSLG